MVLAFEGEEPQVAEGVYVAENATLVGAVSIGEGSSVWFGAVLRADQNRILVGRRSNIQDNAVLHADPPDYPGSPLVLGDDVTVGHAAVLHGCRIGDGAVIGSGSIVLDGAEIGAGALLGAGALVPPGASIPPGVLAVGAPAKVVRELTAEEREGLARPSRVYESLAVRYRKGAGD
ncbi:gamma carbonic anhydrase family protein [Streptomyces eurythermus]